MSSGATYMLGRVVVTILIAVAVIALVMSRIRRRLRVSPEQRTRAPAIWLVSMTSDARLHRRLRRIAGETRNHAQGGIRHVHRTNPTQAQHLARDLEREIVQLDDRLAVAARSEIDERRQLIGELRFETDRVEELVDRIARVLKTEGTDAAVEIPTNALAELDARITRLETSLTTSHVIESAARVKQSDELDVVGPIDAIPAQLADSHFD